MARLDYAYSLREHLDAAWVARPLQLVQYDGRWQLLIEDPWGELLEGLLCKLFFNGRLYPSEASSFSLVSSSGQADSFGRCVVSRKQSVVPCIHPGPDCRAAASCLSSRNLTGERAGAGGVTTPRNGPAESASRARPRDAGDHDGRTRGVDCA